MTTKLLVEQLLVDHDIHYKIPTDLPNDEQILEYISKICEILLAVQPPLLSANKLENLDALMRVTKDNARLFNFYEAIIRLFNQDPLLLNQNTFTAICRITTTNIDNEDIVYVVECFGYMQMANLLTKENIQKLIDKIINQSLSKMNAHQVASSSNGSVLKEPSCAEQLMVLLDKDGLLGPDYFNLLISSKVELNILALNIEKLRLKGLYSLGNCQALVDGEVTFLNPSIKTQEDFNFCILNICDQKLEKIKKTVIAMPDKGLMRQHAWALYKKLLDIVDSLENIKDPRNFLHALAIIENALPTKNNKPSKEDIDKLIALGEVSEGHPFSEKWRAAGLIMMLLGAVLGAAIVATGITALTVSTAGIVMPLAVTATCGVAQGLAGVGFFAYRNSRSGLSKNIMDFAESLPAPAI